MAVKDVEDEDPDRAIDIRVRIGQSDVKEPLLSRLLTGGCDNGRTMNAKRAKHAEKCA